MDVTFDSLRADGRSWTLSIPGTDGAWDWLHFDLVHAQARQEIECNPDLPTFARAVLLGTDEYPRIVSDGHAVAGVLPAYARTGDADAFEVTHCTLP